MAQMRIPKTTITLLLVITIMFTGTITSVVNVWAGTFPGPNGQIAFVSIRDGNEDIYVMNADGSGQTRLTDDPANDLSPSWSPDGEKISFSSNRDNGDNEIYVMNADDGSQKIRLTNNNANDLSADWGTNTSPLEGDGSSSASTLSQQTSDETISVNTNDINNDVLLFLIDGVECFTNNGQEFSNEVQVCLDDTIDQYFDNSDDNSSNNSDSQDNNVSRNNNDTSST
ncbi:MAG: TolB family protein [Nitrososphaeraceae archaeon]